MLWIMMSMRKREELEESFSRRTKLPFATIEDDFGDGGECGDVQSALHRESYGFDEDGNTSHPNGLQ